MRLVGLALCVHDNTASVKKTVVLLVRLNGNGFRVQTKINYILHAYINEYQACS